MLTVVVLSSFFHLCTRGETLFAMTSLASSCVPSTFSPELFGGSILSISASVVTNTSFEIPGEFRFTQPSVNLTADAVYCNVTVNYTHPGQNDSIIVETWLPIESPSWNGRLQTIGGGGWQAGRFWLTYVGMQGALADGYVTVTTDAGLGQAEEASPWALLSPGNVNFYAIQNLASVSLNDEAIIAKSLIESFYGRKPDYSYWNGCSQGGRQGMMMAQRYPDAYDGLAIGAPGIYWSKLVPSISWPQQVMNMLKSYPHGCEFDAFMVAAVEACDGLDGVEDGMVSDIVQCINTFDAFSLVGQPGFNCSEPGINVTQAAAVAFNATTHGMTTAGGKKVWHGLSPATDLTGNNFAYSLGQLGVLATNCTSGTCVGAPRIFGDQWMQFFVANDYDLNTGNLTHQEFDRFVHLGTQRWASITDTDDADLTAFRDAGGKMLSWHGLVSRRNKELLNGQMLTNTGR
ncbi:tannase and feruloyl esterase-domain-containing protein [Podospora fimiseda]|uniref:Carboxylic ester hydrolase n=1 Tax=Podospora fimiseda TaxID=252190 RepID=A0AAN7BGQ9_9PEZI|nr:tannase and feruloyl esterase-domain-containing protein [Podospora fimiseda]